MGVPKQIIVRDGKQNFCLKIAKALIAVEAWRQAIRTDGGRAQPKAASFDYDNANKLAGYQLKST